MNEEIIKSLSTGGQGALLILIALILLGVFIIIKKIMDINEQREQRLHKTINDNQDIIKRMTKSIVVIEEISDKINVIENDVKEIKNKVG